MPLSYILALGSNIGDRAENMQRGLAELTQRDSTARVLARAPIYETEPVDCPPGSPSFFNTVVELESKLSPHDLYYILRSIEHDLGRPDERERNAPRPLDMDIIAAGDLVINDDILTVPHPRFHQRRFVLAPLADICPERVLPGFDKTVAELLGALDLTR